MAISLTDTKSAELFSRACRVLPGGVNSPVRAMGPIGRDPIFIDHGNGAEIVDIDGNTYVDYVCSWGPLIHGHAPVTVVEAIHQAAVSGASFGAPTAAEVELAEAITVRMGNIDVVRMTSSGTEATMSALRLARAVTGRERVLKFAGHYHGHVDSLLAQAGSGLATNSLPTSAGVSRHCTSETVVIPFNDRDALLAAFERYEFAAVIAEPFAANMGLILPAAGFLELMAQTATQNGALTILDEVITGFRVAAGGAQELTGVRADLTILGKVVGGGLPLACYGGRRELMERIAPAGDVYQAGTLSGNPLAVAAGLATLELLDDSAYARLAAITTLLADGLRRAAGDRPVQISYLPGLLCVFFSEHAVHNYADASNCDCDAYAQWCRALLARGVYPPPSQFECWFPSLAHNEEHISRTIEAATAAFSDIQ